MRGSYWCQCFSRGCSPAEKNVAEYFNRKSSQNSGSFFVLPQIHCNGIGDVRRHIPSHVIHIVSEFFPIPCCCGEKHADAACQLLRDWDQFRERRLLTTYTLANFCRQLILLGAYGDYMNGLLREGKMP